MSVVVKGMRMPTRCLECPMYDGYNYSCKLCSFRIPARYNYEGATRPEWCPLVDLGKHGNLIDRGAFKADYGMKDDCADCEKEMHGKVKACEYDRIYSKMDFCGWLDDADVVIEAEDGE